MLPLMSEGSAIVSISSNGGLGWSRRIPVLMEAIGQQGFDAFMKWCEANTATVREGYSFSKELVIAWTMLLSESLIKKGIRINCTMPGPPQTRVMMEYDSSTKASVLEGAEQPNNSRTAPEGQNRRDGGEGESA